jgi:hypothetical protein
MLASILQPRSQPEAQVKIVRPDRPSSRLLETAVASGAVVCAVTAAVAAAAGARSSGSAVAPINAISHVVHGSRAARVRTMDATHTGLGLAINFGASAFWAGIYEAAFGRAAESGELVKAAAGAAAVATLAYVTDYHVVPKRLTPGWEERKPPRSLALIYGALAICLPVRGLILGAISRRRTEA